MADPGYWLSGAGSYWSQLRQRIQTGPVFSWRFIGPVPERLAMVPPDLRPNDPLVARDIYEGRFLFSGRMVETGGVSPFAVEPPSIMWAEHLHGFRWLRHLKGAGSDLASANAQALVNDWLQSHGRALSGTAWRLDVTAARVISWMQYSRLLLTNSDHDFYRRFMASLARQVRFLRGLAPAMRDDIEALQVRIALCFASQVLPTSGRNERSAARNLAFQLRRQILADGGHVSRCPDALPGLLADLLPLTQCYITASKPVPQDIVRAIDRMYPALRFFRHGDGHLAMFHGAGGNSTDLAAAILRHDQSGAKPMTHAPHSGYQRLSQGATVVIADTGLPPSGINADNAHASCLAFELSNGPQRIVVNSGIDRLNRESYRDLARMTAAHSTLVLENSSSARFARFGRQPRGNFRTVSGPGKVEIERKDNEVGQAFTARHDGYVRQFGVLHERALLLTDDGTRLEGRDRLIAVNRRQPSGGASHHFDIRFHLHPAVHCVSQQANSVRLESDGGDIWDFEADTGTVTVEESINFAGVAGPLRTQQIVISGAYPKMEAVNWRFFRPQSG
jgi:uncharacterized heparinase superfamily protein